MSLNIVPYYLVILSVFLFGGLIQLLGKIGYTTSTLLISIIIFLYAFILIFETPKINFKLFVTILLLLIIIIISGLSNGAHFINILYYLFQIALFIGCFIFINRTPKRTGDLLVNMLFIISLIQLPVIILQRLIYPYLGIFNLNPTGIRYEDFAFGTFFLAEDHALGFLLFSFFILIVTNKFQVTYLSKWLVLSLLIVTILIINSKITILFLLSFGVYFLFRKAPIATIIVFIVSIVCITLLRNHEPIKGIVHKVEFSIAYLQKEYSDEQIALLMEDIYAGRLEVLQYYYINPINIIGEGPGSFRNIISGEMLNANFSQLLWYYRDIGLLGLILSFIMLFYNQSIYKSSKSLFFFGLMVIYSLFANVFFSLAFLLLYNLFLKFSRDNEHSNYTLPRLEKDSN